MNAYRSTRPSYRSPLCLAIASALACLAAAPVVAQDDAQTAAAAETEQLEVVVVTANKREEDIREVAASISVIGERQLENMGANSLSDYADLIPGLQVQDNGTPGLTSVSMRGISALSSGATVATYIDDVPLGSSGIYQSANILALDLLPYDIERIEVLRGPQGTLYGAGAIGGLLKYVTREPDLVNSEFRASLGLTSVADGESDWRWRVSGSVPLQEDRMALRVSVARNGIPGFTDNAVDGSEDINGGSQASGRAVLVWRGDGLDIDLSVLEQRIRSDNRANVALDPETYEPLFGDNGDQLWQPQPFEKDITLAALSLDWDLGWGNFVSATAWSQTDTLTQLDATVQFGEVANLLLGLPDPGSAFVRYDFDLDKISQEFRLTSKSGGPFEWMVGAFYTKEDALQTQVVPLFQLDGTPLPPPANEAFGILARIALPSHYKETALFANGSWRVSERFKIDAGVRFARNEQDFSQNVSEGILAPIGDVPGESDEDVFTWSLSPQFTLSEDVMIYARAATGYQPGGPNVALPGIPPSVDSSMLASYEIGVKSLFADRRAQLDVAAFRIDWDDIQVASSFNGIGGLVNGGEATSEGVELSSSFRATDALQLGFNAAYTKARVKNDFEATVIPQDGFDVVLNTGLGGDRMPYVPRWSWALTGEYTFDTAGGFHGQVGGAYRHVGDRLNGTTERLRATAPGDPSTILQEIITEPLELDSYNALDLYAGFGRGPWELRFYVNNVTDERAYSSITLISGAVSDVPSHLAAVPIQPRTFGIEFDYSF